MAENPFVGTSGEESWQQGFDDGRRRAFGEPDVGALVEDQAAIYTEGFRAGQAEARRAGIPVAITLPPEQLAGVTVGTILHAGEVAADVGLAVKAAVEAGEAAAALAELPALLLGLFLLVALETEPPADSPVPPGYLDALRSACEQTGFSEVFLPVCMSGQHSDSGDGVLDAGHWHGRLFTDFFNAQGEAVAHLSIEPEALGSAGIVHYVTASPGMIEFIYIE
jgi:hypothetical protein